MGSEAQPLHILFFPFMAPGHMLPMVDMAVLFSARGVKSTILTTPGNVRYIQPSIDHAKQSAHRIPVQLLVVPFPAAHDLPDGCENLASLPGELHPRLFAASEALRRPFSDTLDRLGPDCVVTDLFFPYSAHVAADHGIPRILFHGSNFFAGCVSDAIQQHKVLENLGPSESSFVVPGLPDRIELRRTVMPDPGQLDPALLEIFRQVKEAQLKTYGTIMNTFYELEPAYADYSRDVLGRRAWSVGPLFLCNKDVDEAPVDRDSCLKWLDDKEPGSVVYVCFGSLGDVTAAQLREIALGLETSNHVFVWVVRAENEEWMPEGFEERIEGKGLIIRGWAPQMLILSHDAVGGFVTHCGWNSILEGVSAGLAFATWPLFAEQFYNERLVVDVLKIGVAVGSDEYVVKPEERKVIEAARIAAAIDELMSGEEEAVERRRRARELGGLARRAVQEEGSSYNDLDGLIHELAEKRGVI